MLHFRAPHPATGTMEWMGWDVAVVGAGIIGGSIAWRLRQRGASVILLDRGRVGGEASWAGAGMLAPGGEIETRSAWSDLALESLRRYPDFVGELAQETGVSIDFQQQGAVEVALTEDEAAELDRRAAAQVGIGIPSEPIASAAVPLLAPGIVQARFFPEDALVDPRHITRALRSACLSAGVELREGTRV